MHAGAFGTAAVLAGCALPPLVPSDAPPTPGPMTTTMPTAPKLAGSSWYWLGTMTPAGLVGPADPGAFNLEFLDGGQLAVQLDCNTGGATWQQSGRTLTLGPVKSTRKACPAASEAERFGRQLPLVRSAVLSMGLLQLSLGDAGTMVMARDPDWKLRSYDCPNGAPSMLVATGRDQAVVRWRDESWQMRQQSTASGVRYASDTAILFTKGNEASLVSQGKQVAGPCIARR
jgi:heat shock protein HslJ